MGRTFVDRIRETAGDGWPWMTQSQWQDMLAWLEWLKKIQTGVCAFNQMTGIPEEKGLGALAALGDAINMLAKIGDELAETPGAFMDEPPVSRED